ncbi:MAG: hypothetical protein ACREFR_06370, partial [Limisphaerales bacterium]
LPAPFHQMADTYAKLRRERLEHFSRIKLESAREIALFLFPLAISWMLLAGLASPSLWRNGLWLVCLLTVVMRVFPLLLSWSSRFPHYSAIWIFPLAVLAAFGLESLLSQSRTRRLAEFLSIATITWLAALYLESFDTNLRLNWKTWTIYSQPQMLARNAVTQYLEKNSDKNLVFVAYGHNHWEGFEWVYNGPEIDAQRIVWAHDLGQPEDRRLRSYYTNRDVWLVSMPTDQKITLAHWNPSRQQFEFAKTFD